MDNVEPNLELDLVSNHTIVSKCIISDTYRNDLYSALCNNRFYYGNNEWSCSFRDAGDIISDIVGYGDYLDYYCSGNEGVVTDEIKQDLLTMGWTIKPYEPRLPPGVYRNKW